LRRPGKRTIVSWGDAPLRMLRMTNLVALAALPLVFGAHLWGHAHAPVAGRSQPFNPPQTHGGSAPGNGGGAGAQTWRPPANGAAPARAAGPQTIHYVVIPIDCRYLTKAAKARMCGRPIMRAAPARAAKGEPR
jgi:hypothetical protein